MRYGGNTPCVEIRCGDRVLIFDAGSGLRKLGEKLTAEGVREADLFLSHTHYDHIIGLPFFCFAHDERNKLHVWAGPLQLSGTIEAALGSYMSPPFFPLTTDSFAAQISYRNFQCGDDLAPAPGVEVRTVALNHPNGATGYRIDYGGKSVCYLTDTVHEVGKPDKNILALIRDADIVIYDSTFTDDEFPSHSDWGHSTWQEGVRLCQGTGVKTLAIFHHLPERDDAALDVIAADAQRAFPGAVVAREGLTLSP